MLSSHTIILFHAHGKKIYIINKLLQRHTIFLFSPNNIFYHKLKRETEKYSIHTQYIYIEKRTPREKFFKKIFFLSFFFENTIIQHIRAVCTYNWIPLSRSQFTKYQVVVMYMKKYYHSVIFLQNRHIIIILHVKQR